MNQLNPRKKFSQSQQASKHKELVLNDDFQRVLELCLAKMALDLPKPESPSQSWDQGCMIMGAKRFIEILLNIGENVNEEKPPLRKTLTET